MSIKNIKDMTKDNIIIFTDGSCKNNGQLNAKAGYGIYFPNNELENISETFTLTPITNQRAELYAIYQAIKLTLEKYQCNNITLYTDSLYSINCLTIWIKKWMTNNWKTYSGKPVKNSDIILMISLYLNDIKYKDKIHFIHVKSHTNNTDFKSIGNINADKLAIEGANKNII